MAVTNREAEQWNRVAHAAAMRRLAQARQEAIARLMAEPPRPLAVTGGCDVVARPYSPVQLGLELVA